MIISYKTWHFCILLDSWSDILNFSTVIETFYLMAFVQYNLNVFGFTTSCKKCEFLSPVIFLSCIESINKEQVTSEIQKCLSILNFWTWQSKKQVKHSVCVYLIHIFGTLNKRIWFFWKNNFITQNWCNNTIWWSKT